MMNHFSGKRVLIVEDNPILAYDLEDLLGDIGMEGVGPALDLSAGLRLARENALDAALLDIDIGNELVWPLASELRARRVPVIFISAGCYAREFPEELRVYPCLEKPASTEVIVESLSQALAA